MKYAKRAFLEIRPEALRHNVNAVMERLPKGTGCCLVVKANAYGHGAEEIALALEEQVDFFALATVTEALELRAAGIKKPLLVLGHIWAEDYEEAIRREIRFNIFREEDAEALSAKAEALGKKAYVHLKLDSGMHRLGFPPTEESAQAMLRISRLPGIEVEGLFTHFAKADEADLTAAYAQLVSYCNFRTRLGQLGLAPRICHVANSAASMVMPEAALDMVRLGIVAYGVDPCAVPADPPFVLEPVLSLKSHVSFVKDVEAGAGISYGYTYMAPKPCRIATVPVGYADGYSRQLSNKGEVLIHGRRAPIRGRVCMDQLMVDVTDIPDVKEGDTVTLIGRDGDEEITVTELEAKSGILSYELLCGLDRKRVPKIYL